MKNYAIIDHVGSIEFDSASTLKGKNKMNTYTSYNNLTTTEYEKLQKKTPWTNQSKYKPVNTMSFKHFIYSFGDYMIRPLRFWNEGSDTLSDTEVSICKAYYETACEMNLTHFQFDSHFIGLEYQPSEEEKKQYDAMEQTIITKMKEKLDITEEITRSNKLWECISKMI